MLGQGEHAGVVAAEVELQLGVDVEGVCNVVTLDRIHWIQRPAAQQKPSPCPRLVLRLQRESRQLLRRAAVA